jgi:hypothetical protein
VRFVLTIFPKNFRKILVCTDRSLSAEAIIVGYSYQFKIEATFKALVRWLMGCCYRFWMKSMKRRKRGGGDQYLHRRSKAYREAVARKIGACERFVNVAAIGLGSLQVVALTWPTTVWTRFASWLRTRPVHGNPSENVVRQTLRSELARISSRNRRRPLLHEILKGSRSLTSLCDPLVATG